ncbi:MAG: hypothetical protein PHS79_04840 [Patescibacteria group bacterium]|nr:hypothetical protein [Patescibacteria group bacterium]
MHLGKINIAHWLKIVPTAITVAALSAALFLPATSLAAGGGLDAIGAGVKGTANAAGLAQGDNSGDLSAIVGKLIGAVMGLVGVILFVYMVYGGFRWMTAAGDAKAVTEAQAIIRNAIIGIVIIALAYAITDQVLQYLVAAQSSSGQTPATQ